MHPIYMRTSLCEPKSHSTPSHDGSCRLYPKSLIPVSSSWSDGVASGEECGLTVFLDLVGVVKWLPFGRFPSMAVKIWANNCISSKASKKLYEKGMYLSVWYLFYFLLLFGPRFGASFWYQSRGSATVSLFHDFDDKMADYHSKVCRLLWKLQNVVACY